MATRFTFIDIGNRRLKVLALDSPAALLDPSSGDAGRPVPAEWNLEVWPLDAPHAWSRPAAEPTSWWIASVHRPTAMRLARWLRRFAPDEPVHWLQHEDFRSVMEADVDQPGRVGIDRLAAACGALVHARPPLLAVDVGTAVTVDLVLPPARFAGGAILPGPDLMAEALARGTDALPAIADPVAASPFPGKNTVAAIRCGIAAAVRGAVATLRDQAVRQTGEQPIPVYITGGQGEHLAEAIPEAVFDPLLIFRGMARVAESVRHHSAASGRVLE